MKVVINNDFGGFGLGIGEKCKKFIEGPYWHEEARTQQDFIEFVENNPDECGDLAIAIVPDEATDWIIREYDGLEEVIYVMDGKIHYAGIATDEDDDEDFDLGDYHCLFEDDED